MSASIDIFNHPRVHPHIDKITFCGHANTDILHDDIETLVAREGNNQFLYQHYVSNQYQHFTRLHSISYKHYYPNGTNETFTISIKVGFNGMGDCGTEEEQHRFEIEFNPNKFVIPDWLSYYFQRSEYIVETAKNIDFAIDFAGFLKRDFKYVLRSGNTICTSIGTTLNKTDYIGKQKTHNRIKVYDKKKERQKYYDMDFETTRVEITLYYTHKFCYSTVEKEDMLKLVAATDALEQIFIADDLARDPFVYALSCLSPEQLINALSMMASATRTKYKRLLKETSGFQVRCDTTTLMFFLSEQIKKILRESCIQHEDSWIRGNFSGSIYFERIVSKD